VLLRAREPDADVDAGGELGPGAVGRERGKTEAVCQREAGAVAEREADAPRDGSECGDCGAVLCREWMDRQRVAKQPHETLGVVVHWAADLGELGEHLGPVDGADEGSIGESLLNDGGTGLVEHEREQGGGVEDARDVAHAAGSALSARASARRSAISSSERTCLPAVPARIPRARRAARARPKAGFLLRFRLVAR
jgi:hypothetical protein